LIFTKHDIFAKINIFKITPLEAHTMIKSILIATDGSPNSMVATQYGCCLAKLFKAEVCGLNVVDVRALEGPLMSDISGSMGFEPYQSYLPKFEQILQERADGILEDFKGMCAEHGVTAEVKRLSGIVSNVIAEEAKRVDLVVIAQHGEHAQWSAGLLGSTTETVIRKSPRPVLVAPKQYREIKKVLIAYDGSNEATRGLKTACETFVDLSCELHVVFATDEDAHADELATEIRDYVGHHRIEVALTRLTGAASKGILHHAEQHDFDLIVMGAFGHSRLHDLILGGTAAYMIRETKIPIMLNR
jgi:nucleotide-binding universal stress UspA family protein